MLNPWLLRFAHRIERITQAHQPIRAQFIRQQTGHAPAHGLAADGQRPSDMASHLGIHLTPAFQQFRRRVRRALAAIEAPLRHVGKLEAQHVDALSGEACSHVAHPVAVHRCAGAMGEDQRRRSLASGGIPQPSMIPHALRPLIPVNTGLVPFVHACLAFSLPITPAEGCAALRECAHFG
ncbi:hypothetical protein D3C84_609770 [compost metagenome]